VTQDRLIYSVDRIFDINTETKGEVKKQLTKEIIVNKKSKHSKIN
jgi:hypothetical protein